MAEGRRPVRGKRSSNSSGLHGASEPAQIHALVSKKIPRIGYTTVYRTMKLLTELGLAASGSLLMGNRYEPISGQEHHDHFILWDAGRSLNFETMRLRPYRRGLQNGIDSRPFIIGWSSTDDAPIAGPGEEDPRERREAWNARPLGSIDEPLHRKSHSHRKSQRRKNRSSLTILLESMSRFLIIQGPPSRSPADRRRSETKGPGHRHARRELPHSHVEDEKVTGISSSMNRRPISCR